LATFLLGNPSAPYLALPRFNSYFKDMILGGMLFGTIFGVIIVPGLYYIFGTIANGRKLIKNEEYSSLTGQST
jgi:hypothetical protein